MGFVAYFSSFTTGICVTYAALFLLVDRLVMPDRDVSLMTYPTLLLTQVSAPRVIIDSGSNSLHSIVPEMIEAAFSRPTFVVADNVDVPILIKLSRLEKYSRQGDIIILPLEWQYYFKDWYPSDFIANMLNVLNGSGFSAYYFALSTADKLDLVLHYINFRHVLDGVKRRLNEPRSLELFAQYHHMIERNERSIYGDYKSDANRIRETFGRDCHRYISVEEANLGVVRKIAQRLSALQRERKARVILTWPAVAGDQCYDPQSIGRLTGKIKEIFSRAGVAVLGAPTDSYFSDDHVLDTFYHIDGAAAKERTRRLIEAVREQGLAPSPEKYPSTPAFVKSALAQKELEMSDALLQVQDGIYRPESEEFFKHFLLLEGWYGPENWGVWSRGTKSRIALRTGDGSCALTLNPIYFGSSRPSRVLINNQLIESDDGAPIALPTNETVRLEFEHHDVTSPRALGLSSDRREVAYGLQTIGVTCLTGDALVRVQDGIYHPGSEEFVKHFQLLEGWSFPESWGLWSRGAKSTIALRTGDGGCALTLDSTYFANSRPSRILVNNRLIESDDGAPIALPANKTVRLQFEHHDVTSPQAIGYSSDSRDIAYGLKTIGVKCLTATAQHQATFQGSLSKDLQ
jgi:hypothetical protein